MKKQENSGSKTLQKTALTAFSAMALIAGLFTFNPVQAKNGADDVGFDDRGGSRSSSRNDNSGRELARIGQDGAHQNRGSGDDDFGRNSADDNSRRVSVSGISGEDNPARLNDDGLTKVNEGNNESATRNDDRMAIGNQFDGLVGDNGGRFENRVNDDNQKGFFGSMTDKFVATLAGLFK